jgi:hypothetical protein
MVLLLIHPPNYYEEINMVNQKCIVDMYLAAALLSYGAKLISVDRKDKRRQKFYFENSVSHIWSFNGTDVKKIPNPTLEEVECEYLGKTLMFQPNYTDSIRSIKSAIHVE